MGLSKPGASTLTPQAMLTPHAVHCPPHPAGYEVLQPGEHGAKGMTQHLCPRVTWSRIHPHLTSATALWTPYLCVSSGRHGTSWYGSLSSSGGLSNTTRGIRMAWAGRNLKIHPVPTLLPWEGVY